MTLELSNNGLDDYRDEIIATNMSQCNLTNN